MVDLYEELSNAERFLCQAEIRIYDLVKENEALKHDLEGFGLAGKMAVNRITELTNEVARLRDELRVIASNSDDEHTRTIAANALTEWK